MPLVIRRNATGKTVISDVGKEAQTDQFHTLVLEDDLISQAMITQAVFRVVPDGLVLSARTLAEGRELLAEYEFHFCVLDIQLPDGIGIDFLHDIQRKSPNASVVIFTAQPLPEYRYQAEAFGVLHFMEKTANLRVLGVHAHNQWERTHGARAGADTGFSASLTRLTTLDLIQIKCLGGATVTLDFASRHGQHGKIFFKSGEIIHAETPGRQGVDAFNEIISWREGRVTELTDTPEPERTIQGNWQGLLMHAVHWADEHRQ